MRATRPSALATLLLIAAGVAYGADAASGTLDETKQELRQLQNEQKNKAGQTAEKPKLGTPGMELQIQDSNSSAAWLADRLNQEKKLDRQKKTTRNWLVDGVEKLEKEGSRSRGPMTGVTKDGANDEASPVGVDQSDPQYLLHLFDEQKKATGTKSNRAKSSAPASPDAFAPFMQGWLGTSPVRGQFFDQFVKKPAGGGASGGLTAGPADYRSLVNPANAEVAPGAPRDSVVMDKGNPYLTELNQPIPAKEGTGEATQLQSRGAPAIAPEAWKGGPVLLPVDPAPDARERRKTPLPGLTDDKKYFPQLKKF